MSSNNVSRRDFLQTAAVGATAGSFIYSKSSQAAAPNDRISVGFIGVGMMGRGHLGRFLNFDDVQINAICEIEQTRRENAIQSVEKKYAGRRKAGTFKGVKAYTDFRELLARDDIDAVVIATPDHWHALMCLAAAKAKKDIYCEKPLTHSIQEGRMIVDCVKKHDVVFQTGSQQRSEFAQRFRKAVQFVWAGRIGDLKTIRVGVGAAPVPCDLPAQEEPGNVDWNMWQGPAPTRAYNEILCPKGIHRHFPAFRKYREYAGGGLADMGAHHFDIAQWAMHMDNSGPVKIEPPKDGATTGLRFEYANGVEMFHGGKSGCTFEGTEGTIYVNRPVLEATPKTAIAEPLGARSRRVYPSNDHRRNWVDCIRSRKETICPPEVGHRTATVCHLANLGYQLQRPLHWDPKKEEFVNDAEANKLRFREPRAPWKYDIG